MFVASSKVQVESHPSPATMPKFGTAAPPTERPEDAAETRKAPELRVRLARGTPAAEFLPAHIHNALAASISRRASRQFFANPAFNGLALWVP